MRIISGKYKGRKLQSSNDLRIRPTTDRVKEFIFNILQDFPENKIVIDIFSGSGSLGLEALSRGATKVFFVDNSPASIEILKTNLQNIKLTDNDYEIILSDALNISQHISHPIDLLLLDPPFIYPEIQQLLNHIFESDFVTDQSMLVIEHEISNPIEQDSDRYEIIKQKKFGRSLVSFLIKKGKEDE
jgi:16S rRNA (guanine966-N2)-methyltransferase